ncbi:aminoglycoside phosphotransferase family protein [Actinotalea sp. K2]|uniref:phosphotransferase enzyme family protein n=1 Tax=Actinotalea sp. K2 TaxID=2939438 RepID=UPI002017D0C3|nr:aminoglycoside phosphotransferase family protein [Actinotalea sp. K2]MCL3861783.1 aminoglycoside phosphotransferase family protein [Actinotalea sp. K2]
MADDEVVLATGGVTHVVRVGPTVRRPWRPFTATIQSYLGHLHEHGFDAAPLPLGVDDRGREVLSYVPGHVPLDPLPDDTTTDEVLVALVRLVRRLHDAAQSWVPPSDAVFGGIPGRSASPLEPLFDRPELVAHQDYCPGNVVFREGLPAALIDFDLARPTTRVADLVNLLHWWAPLQHPVDRAPALAEVDVAARVRVAVDAYGLTPDQRAQVVPVAVARARNSVHTMRAAAEADPVFRAWWESGTAEKVTRTRDWVTAQSPRLAATLA